MLILKIFRIVNQCIPLLLPFSFLLISFSSCKPTKEIVDSSPTTTNTQSPVVESTTLLSGFNTTTTKLSGISTSISKTTSTSTSRITTTTIGTTVPRTVAVTIPEGWTVTQIAKRLAAKGVCSEAEYLKAINTFDFSPYHNKITNIVSNVPNLCYKYEGYQFPETYEFHKNEKAANVVGIMMREAGNRIPEKYSYPGFTTHQIVTLASIIELEAAESDVRKMVSSVFHNRINNNMRLDSDVTIKYMELYVSEEQKETYKYYYSTKRFTGLPAGPICNPGDGAIYAAVHPADTDYLFFFSDKSGEYHFSETLEEHEQKRKDYA